MSLYRQVDVWKRLGEGRLCCYRCLRLEPEGSYVVQSADFLDSPADQRRLAFLDKQFRQLLAEEAPEIRSRAYATLDEAIAAFDDEFPP